MTQDSTLNTLNLNMLPFNERACAYRDEIFMSDNFDEPYDSVDLSNDPQILNFISSPYPFKVQFAMMLLCLDGYMRVNLNLNEYVLQRNCIQIVIPGTIGQCIEISPDCRMAVMAFAHVDNLPEGNSQSALIVRKYLIDNTILRLSDSEMDEMLGLYHHMQKKYVNPKGYSPTKFSTVTFKYSITTSAS